jgi:protein-disulfide isomerase
VLALAADLWVLGWSLRLGPATPPALQRKAWAALFPAVILVAGAAVWFVALQVFVVRAICPYCMLAHASGFAGAILLLVTLPFRAEVPPTEVERGVYLTAGWGKRGAGIALVGLAALAAGQVVYTPKSYIVTPQASAPPATKVPATATALSTASNVVKSPVASNSSAPPTSVTSPAPRLFPVYGGRIQLDLDQVPSIGSTTNELIMVSLFDYTCHHCRAMHPRLTEAQQLFKDRLAIVSLPMPLDPGCNPTMQRPNPLHTNACAYARLGLIVWRADRNAHAAFDDWLMTGERPPPLAEAQAKAAELVGLSRLEKASQDPWIEAQLRQDVAVYEQAYQLRQGSMPQLLLGSNLAVGTYARDELLKLLEQNLGLKAAP